MRVILAQGPCYSSLYRSNFIRCLRRDSHKPLLQDYKHQMIFINSDVGLTSTLSIPGPHHTPVNSQTRLQRTAESPPAWKSPLPQKDPSLQFEPQLTRVEVLRINYIYKRPRKQFDEVNTGKKKAVTYHDLQNNLGALCNHHLQATVTCVKNSK